MKKEISAEMLLNYLYPEKEYQWKVSCKGSFYRNYNDDSIKLDPDASYVELARDGFLKYLPDGLLSDVEDLRKHRDKSGAYEKINFRRNLLTEAFSPLDNFNFKERLYLEKQVSSVLYDKVKIILQDYFDINLDGEKDPLVRKLMMWMPFVSDYRGDLHFVKMLLRKLLECEVELDLSHRFSESDSTRAWLPEVRYTVVIPDLDSGTFCECLERLAPLKAFIEEWFMPFDVNFVMDIRPHGSSERGAWEGILDYNCELQS